MHRSSTSYALDTLPWTEVRAILKRESRLLLPVGSLDQHGPHLPLGTNTFIAERLARDVSSETGVLLAPTLPYGVSRTAGSDFAGANSLRRKTFHRAVNELLAGWEDQGVTEFVIVSAYRYEPHLDALLMALTETALTTVIDLYLIDVDDLLEASPEAEHAGELETSLMLHLAPERVRTDAVPEDPSSAAETSGRYIRSGMPTPRRGFRGMVGRASLASAEKGRRIYERYRTALTTALGRDRGG